MIRIGIISDTHLSEATQELDRLIRYHFNDIEIILHAGDLVHMDVLKAFGKKHIHAVCGNMDKADVVKTLPRKKVIEIDGYRIGLIHGGGNPSGMESRLRDEFDDVQCIVYGHTHKPYNEVHEGILFFNPGTPTDKIFAPFNSLGILIIDAAISGSIIRLS
jgi:uncharacterized protein